MRKERNNNSRPTSGQKAFEVGQRAEKILQTSIDGFCVVSLDGRIIRTNPALSHISGYSKEELLQMKIEDLEVIESPEQVAQHIDKIIQQRYDRFETKHRHKDGSLIHVEVSTQFCDFADDKFFYSFIRDITTSKQAEKEIRESEKRYQTLFETSAVATCLLDPATSRHIDCNPSALELFGYTQDQFLDLLPQDISPPLQPDGRNSEQAIAEHFAKAMNGSIANFEWTFRRSNGEEFTALAQLTPFPSKEKILILATAIDITELKNTQKQLGLSENRYRTLFENTPVAVLIMDPETGKPLECNDMALEFTGLPKEEFLSSVTAERISTPLQPDGSPSAQKAAELLNQASKGEPLNFEWTFIGPGGEQRIGFVQLAPFRSGDKNLVLLASVDITELKDTSDQLHLSENRYKMLVESAEQVICRVNSEGTFLFLNQFAADGLGAKPEDLVGKTMCDLFPKKFADKNMALISKSLKSDAHVFEEYETEVMDEKRWYQVHIWPIREPGETIKSALVFANEITSQKKIEQELQESYKRLQTLSEAAFEGIVIHEGGNVIDANNKFQDIFGYDLDELKEMDAYNLITPDSQEIARKHVDSGLQGPYEVIAVRKDGSTFPAEVQAKEMVYQDRRIRFAAIRDISQRKQFEKERQALQDKIFDAQKHAYMGSACAILAHDINQPLTVINMLLGKALEIVDDDSCCPEVIEKIKESLLESRKAADLSRTMRKYIRDSAFDITDSVDLGDLAKRIVSVLHDKTEAAKMDISIKGFEDLPQIQFNEISLEQIFVILIQNAIDAADGSAKSKLDITAKMAEDKIELMFSDNCGGIPPENLKKVFEPFFTTKAKKGRMGLGLEIVKQIMINCGAEIRLESKLGKGAAFFITLPIKDS
ncbi:MAG: PAS domain S-box protein [Planctomycetota bacterium]